MAAEYSNILAFDATTFQAVTGTGAQSKTLTVAATGLGISVPEGIVLGIGSFTAALTVASSGTGVSDTGEWSNILDFEAATLQAVTGTGAQSASLTAASAGTGTADQPQQVTGTGTQAKTLTVASSGTGTVTPLQLHIQDAPGIVQLWPQLAIISGEGVLLNQITGTGAQAKTLIVASSGTGTVTPLQQATGAAAFALTLLAACTGSGTVQQPQQVTGTGSQAVTLTVASDGSGTAYLQQATGAGAFAASLTAQSSGTGAVTAPGELTGTGSFTAALTVASTGSGDVAQPQQAIGSGAFSAGINATSSGAGTAAQPQQATGTGAHTAAIDTAQAGEGFIGKRITMVAPLADPADRLTSNPDLAAGDVVWVFSVIGGGHADITLYTDGSFAAAQSVTGFYFRVNDGSGFGAAALVQVEDPVAGVVGTGNMNAGSADLDGAGQRGIQGSGAATTEAATAVGIGQKGLAGTALLTAQHADISGIGQYGDEIAGSGHIYGQQAAMDGAGQKGIAGAGNLDGDEATLDGTGLLQTQGSGSLHSQPAQTNGEGLLVGGETAQIYDAPGIVYLPSQRAVIAASGEVVLPLAELEGDGALYARIAHIDGWGDGLVSDDIHDAPGVVRLFARHADIYVDAELVEWQPPASINGFGILTSGEASLEGRDLTQLRDAPGIVYLPSQRASVLAAASLLHVIEETGTPADLEAQPAEVIGAGVVGDTSENLIGIGVLHAQAAATDGAGARGITGEGYLEPARALVSSPGTIGINALVANLVAQPAEITGEGIKDLYGTGDLAAQSAVIEAEVFVQIYIQGEGDLAALPAEVSGFGAAGINGAAELVAQAATTAGAGWAVGPGGVLPAYDHTASVVGVPKLYDPPAEIAYPAAIGFAHVLRLSFALSGEGNWHRNERLLIMAPDGETQLCSLSRNINQVEIKSGAAFDLIAAAITSGQPFNLYLSAYRVAQNRVNNRPITHMVSLRLMASGTT